MVGRATTDVGDFSWNTASPNDSTRNRPAGRLDDPGVALLDAVRRLQRIDLDDRRHRRPPPLVLADLPPTSRQRPRRSARGRRRRRAAWRRGRRRRGGPATAPSLPRTLSMPAGTPLRSPSAACRRSAGRRARMPRAASVLAPRCWRGVLTVAARADGSDFVVGAAAPFRRLLIGRACRAGRAFAGARSRRGRAPARAPAS